MERCEANSNIVLFAILEGKVTFENMYVHLFGGAHELRGGMGWCRWRAIN
jgi:hypothetical protein